MGRALLAEAVEVALRLAGLSRACDRCGGLVRGATRILVLGEISKLRRCEGCRLPLDEHGRAAGSIGPNGQALAPVIWLFEGPEPIPVPPPRRA